MSNKRLIIDKLISFAATEQLLFDKSRYPKPGDLIKSLSKQDREVIKTLTYKDFNDRIEW